jgi:hypothetical protein
VSPRGGLTPEEGVNQMEHTKQEQEAWMETMLAEHEELRTTLTSVRTFLADPRPDPGQAGFHRWATTMSKQLVDLYDALFRHFRNEEESGVFKDLETRYPRASRRIAALQGEHAMLLGQLRNLMGEVMEYSAGIADDNPRLRGKLTDVLDLLSAHENGETELMQRMLYNDIGEGD